MSKSKKFAHYPPLSLPDFFDHDTTRKASSLQTKLPNGHEKFDEFGGEQLYEKFFDILKNQGEVVLENTIQSYQETDEGAKLISNLKLYIDNCDVREPAEHEVISGIITKTTKKKLRRHSEKETLNSTLPDSFIKLDKVEENQDNTLVKSFNHFFLNTLEQQREAQLEEENLSLKEQLAELEKQLEETKAVLAALIEENRLRFEQIKVLELRVEEAEQKQKKANDKPSICLTNTEFAEEVLRDLKAKKIKKWEDRSSEDPTDPMDFYKTYYQSFSDRMYQFILRKYDEKLIRAMEGRVAYLRKKGEKIQLQDYIPPKRESSDKILSIAEKDIKKYLNLERSSRERLYRAKKKQQQPSTL